MSRIVSLAFAALAIAAPSQVFAGHEWTDGTMGPLQGRLYDTTMPQFPSRERHSTPADQSTALCSNHPDTKSDTAVATEPSRADVEVQQSRITNDAKPGDTCSKRGR